MAIRSLILDRKAEEIKADNEVRMEWNRAVALLERLIAKVMEKVLDSAEKVIGKDVDAIKETPKETESCVHAKDETAIRAEKQKIPFPINTHRKTDAQNRAEQITCRSAGPVSQKQI